jgi:drug/metabolite transporter (DMT)-like permease
VLFALLRIQGVSIAVPRAMRGRAFVGGVLVAVQSYCLYSAVARIPAALALLVFHICPILFLLLSWATRKEAPNPKSLAPMLLALVGLAVALDVRPGDWSARWMEIGAGASWAFAGAAAFALILYCNAYWVQGVDGKVRTLVMTAVAAVLVFIGGASAGALAIPHGALGWLGLALLTVFYGAATTALFVVLPRLAGAATTAALNFEPIALLGLGWLFLGQTASPVQILGALITVSAIAWLSLRKK